jgi:hypothetical protein
VNFDKSANLIWNRGDITLDCTYCISHEHDNSVSFNGLLHKGICPSYMAGGSVLKLARRHHLAPAYATKPTGARCIRVATQLLVFCMGSRPVYAARLVQSENRFCMGSSRSRRPAGRHTLLVLSSSPSSHGRSTWPLPTIGILFFSTRRAGWETTWNVAKEILNLAVERFRRKDSLF